MLLKAVARRVSFAEQGLTFHLETKDEVRLL